MLNWVSRKNRSHESTAHSRQFLDDIKGRTETDSCIDPKYFLPKCSSTEVRQPDFAETQSEGEDDHADKGHEVNANRRGSETDERNFAKNKLFLTLSEPKRSRGGGGFPHFQVLFEKARGHNPGRITRKSASSSKLSVACEEFETSSAKQTPKWVTSEIRIVESLCSASSKMNLATMWKSLSAKKEKNSPSSDRRNVKK